MKKILTLFLCAGFLWSCSSDDDNGGGDVPDNVSILPIKISMAGEDGTFDALYSYNGNKLSKINYSANSPMGNAEMTFQYEGDKVMQMTLRQDDAEIKKVYTYENNRIASITDIWDDFVTTEYTYEWLNDEKVRVTTSANNDYYTTFYLSNGNIVKVEDYFGGNVWKTIYTFDNKSSPFRNVEGFQYLIEDGDTSFNRNNIITDVTTTGDSTFNTDYSYEYNAQGYPTKQIEQSENDMNTMVITYNQ